MWNDSIETRFSRRRKLIVHKHKGPTLVIGIGMVDAIRCDVMLSMLCLLKMFCDGDGMHHSSLDFSTAVGENVG
jgi:hypothetical protein